MQKAVSQRLSFVIPCYYSEKTIAAVVERIIGTVEKDGRYDYEIICVNDGSKDGTYAVLREEAANPKIKVVDLARNFGQHSALMAGFHYVTGDIVVCLDDDGQNPPEEMFRLINKLQEGYDLVSAKYAKDKRTLLRRMGSKVSFAMSHYLINMPDGIELNSYYVMKRFVVDEIIKYNNPYPFVHGLALRVTRNIANVEIRHEERLAGTSGYNLHGLIRLWLNGFTAFSEKPLRIASVSGVICASAGMIYAIVIIIRRLLGNITASGYSSMMAALLFFFGVIMLFLGLIGEYVGRMYICINNAPQYAIRDMKNIEREPEEKTDEKDISAQRKLLRETNYRESKRDGVLRSDDRERAGADRASVSG